MGRKIPGRKHRGVRDPEKQRAEREKQIANKINAPPDPKDDQSLPKSVQLIMALKKDVKDGKFKKKRPKKKKSNFLIDTRKFEEREETLRGMTVPLTTNQKFVQRPNEPDWLFLRRISNATHNLIRETQFEEKFGVEIQRDEMGNVLGIEKSQKKDPVALFIEKDKLLNKKKIKEVKKKEHKNRKQRLKEVKSKRHEAKKSKCHDFQHLQDQVKFGEVAQAPPNLSCPRKVDKNIKPRPGTKDLLLNSILEKDASKVIVNHSQNLKKEHQEKQRLEAVEAYRKLKAMKKLK